MAKANLIASTLTETQINRFWSYVDKASECWLWTRGRTKAGYGMFHPTHGVNCSTHVLSWILTVGEIPDGIEVCHNCPGMDNPACCNPAHLWLGTHAENMRDAFAKGRMANRYVLRGEAHGNRILTDKKVIAIRREYAANPISQRALAAKHGISQALLCGIVNRKGWKHVQE